MTPQLIAIAGPLIGTRQIFTGEDISIGRDSSNALSINDRALSRNHCVIKKDAEGYLIYDLESHNGTFVNEVPIKKHLLLHSDRIQVGNSLFLFVLHEEKDKLSTSESIQIDNGSLFTLSTTRLTLEDALCGMAKDLSALIRIGALLAATRGLQSLQQQLLESILDVVPAESGAILMIDDTLDPLSSLSIVQSARSDNSPTEVSQTIVRQVVREAASILSNEVVTGKPLEPSESLTNSNVSSLLCVPLIASDRVIGVIYLTAQRARIKFTEWHLKMSVAIASFASGALQNAQHIEWLEKENKRLVHDIQLEHNMIGESPRMRDTYQIIVKVAPTDSTVLIRGESGTGKELAARAIHQNSLRTNRPFIAVNCATLNETLLESELFGHERGAFTGAITQKKGKLEVAEGGTVFLDEVGEMALAIQARLLRVLQERTFERVGGTTPIKVNIRIIAATNKDLENAVKQGTFRLDLYYRLNVVKFTMPPLRERGQDILLLANYFVMKYGKKCNRRVLGLSTEARTSLMSHNWPGNVRELENAIESAIVLGSTEYVQREDLPEMILERVSSAHSIAPYHDAVQKAKKAIIADALKRAEGNYTVAAKLLGVHPNNLHRLNRNLNLKSDSEN